MEHVSRLFLLLCLGVLLSVSALAQSSLQPTRPGAQASKPAPNSGIREVVATVSSTNFYVASSTLDLNFTLELTNTDGEYGDSLSLTFPAGITPNSSPNDPFPSVLTGGQTGEALNGVNGQVISWGDNDNNFGGIEPLNVIAFTVNVTVGAGITGDQTIQVFISGDGFGPNPMDLSTSVIVSEQPPGPIAGIGSSATEEFLTALGDTDTSALNFVTNLGGAALNISSVSYANGSAEFVDDLSATMILPGDTAFFEIRYTPTDNQDDVDSLNIVTDGGNFSIPLLGYAYGNGVELESFEGLTFFPDCQWEVSDEDGDGQGWFPAFVTDGFPPHSGQTVIASASWNGSPLTPDNYLILPQITPTATANFLSWFAAAQDPAFPADFYEVYVSTTGNAPADFTTSLFSETLVDNTWRERKVDLTPYIGQNIYIAFRHHNSVDHFVMKMDDIRMPVKTTPDDQLPPLDLTTNVVPVNCPGDSGGGFIVNATGGGSLFLYTFAGLDTFVTDDTMVPISNLAEGSYEINVIDNCDFEVNDTVAIEAANPLDDAGFVYAWTTLCQKDDPVGAVITGLAGGTFTADAGIVFSDSTIGQIDAAASNVGTFNVTYTTNGPCPNSSTVAITIDANCTHVGIEDLKALEMRIYPNPAKRMVFLENQGSSQEVLIQMLDLTGKLILQEETFVTSNSTHGIDISELPTGMYLVKVQSEEMLGVERLLVH